MNRRMRIVGWMAVAGLLVVGPGTPRSAGAAGDEGPLVDAVKRGDRAAVGALLAQHADPNAVEVDGTSPLHWAAYEDSVEIARQLVGAGAKATAINRYGVQPLSLACVNGSVQMITLLLRAGADPNTVFSRGETALMTASRTGRVEAVQALLEAGADVNAKEEWRGQTALMWAAAEGHTEVIRTLVARGADLHARSKGGFSALLFAAREGRIGSARTLMDLGARLDDALPVVQRPADGDEKPAPEAGLNAFLLATGSAHFELATLFLERGADPNAAPRGWTALHQLSWVRKMGIAGSNDPAPQGSGTVTSLDFVRTLVAKGAQVNARVTRRPPAGVTRLNMIGGTPFLLAARTADAELMALLAELGADTTAVNADGTTPLMVAAGIGTAAPGEDPGTESEVLDAVKLAMKLGGDVNAVDKKGETAMHGAAAKHVPSVVQLLADSGARIEVWNQKNEEGHTPLDITIGVHRSMSIIRSPATEAAIRQLMARQLDVRTTKNP